MNNLPATISENPYQIFYKKRLLSGLISKAPKENMMSIFDTTFDKREAFEALVSLLIQYASHIQKLESEKR